MRKPNTAKVAPEAQDLRQRAAQARDAAGRFITRPLVGVTDQPQPTSLTEPSAAEGRANVFPPGAVTSHDAVRGHPDRSSRADAAAGREPRREQDMGRHETFGNATPIMDDLRMGTALGSLAARSFPAPGSAEAISAWHAACREHSIRTAPLQDCSELMRENGNVWSTRSLFEALEAGGITVAEYVRLHPLASERELRFAEVAHELSLGSLFALAYADEYPVGKCEPAPEGVLPQIELSPVRAWAVEQAAAVDLSSLTILQLHALYDRFNAVADVWCAVGNQPWTMEGERGAYRDLNAGGQIVNREEERAGEIRNRIAEEMKARTPTSKLEQGWRLETLIKFEFLCEASLQHAPELRAEIFKAWGA